VCDPDGDDGNGLPFETDAILEDDDPDMPASFAHLLLEMVSANPLWRHAKLLRLPRRVLITAAQSNATRRSSAIAALSRRALQTLLQCVVAIVLRLLHLWAPNDKAGLYTQLRTRLDVHFDVAEPASDVVLQAAHDTLLTLPRRSREARAILVERWP